MWKKEKIKLYCEQCKKEVLGFLEEFIKAIGDQSNARAFVEKYNIQK